MLIFLLLISDTYKKVYNKALERAKAKNTLSDSRDDYSVGKVEDKDFKIVFGMNLTSDASSTIFGHAIEGDVLAISTANRLRNYTDNYAFFETETQKFYEIKQLLDSDEYVSVYSISCIDARRVISEATVHTSKPFHVYKQLNWEGGKQGRAKPLSKYKALLLGMYIEQVIEIKAEFRKWLYFSVETKVLQTGILGVGIESDIALAMEISKELLATPTISLTPLSYISIFSFKIGIGVELESSLSLNFRLDIKRQTSVYRAYILNVEKKIVLSNTKHEESPLKKSMNILSEIINKKIEAELSVTPTYEVSVSAVISAGNFKYRLISFTLGIGAPVSIARICNRGYNSTKVAFGINAYFKYSTDGFNIKFNSESTTSTIIEYTDSFLDFFAIKPFESKEYTIWKKEWTKLIPDKMLVGDTVRTTIRYDAYS